MAENIVAHSYNGLHWVLLPNTPYLHLTATTILVLPRSVATPLTTQYPNNIITMIIIMITIFAFVWRFFLGIQSAVAYNIITPSENHQNLGRFATEQAHTLSARRLQYSPRSTGTIKYLTQWHKRAGRSGARTHNVIDGLVTMSFAIFR